MASIFKDGSHTRHSSANRFSHRSWRHPHERPRDEGRSVDFLTKPVKDVDLLRAVRAALARAADQREAATISARLTRLTPREREVMEHVIAGKTEQADRLRPRNGRAEHSRSIVDA